MDRWKKTVKHAVHMEIVQFYQRANRICRSLRIQLFCSLQFLFLLIVNGNEDDEGYNKDDVYQM